ncbi:metabotropic glutamate receptor 4 [Nematostella vectensis]|nr:metabotropic glutamate receptor 4 [Nematostella vectensis]XP_048581762.1 metabotropic glutamate receptor 4 [Nematostella vectensis]XP_048581763.1 metabotropic glutamate receptor 4 [Nematostella vectensis]XP_048581764.1 metabotropic glutamate receptor 4 [Nematostella vectensis]XP_048581765.1 metabotropic glutamate receptor 4 [Nematostella vectensis]XP_048581766.1 metabotropic glutamate receptor 4 [Nematostella vectensis]XP_048581767.1 metabotropic glutamate receptor 4 [Nematostella vectensi
MTYHLIFLIWCLSTLVPSLQSLQPNEFKGKNVFKAGDVIIGALLPIHERGDDSACGSIYPLALGYAETLIYTFDLINNSSELSPGVTLGYDIRDYCDSPTLAMKQTYDFVQQNFILDANNANACGRNTSSTPSSAVTSPDARAPVVAVIGAYDSGTTVLIAELLQVVEIPLISPFSSSEQLNNEFYKAFFRTIPPDGQQARTISDIIEYFNWTYVAPLAVDSSYGRYGVDALIAQSQKRSTFCMRPTAFFPRSGYQERMETIVEQLKKLPLIKVIVLWANNDQSLALLKAAMNQNLHDRIWIISDDLATSAGEIVFHDVSVKGTFLGVAHHYHSNEVLKDYLEMLSRTGPRHGWWNEYVQKEFNCTWDSRSGNDLRHCGNQSMEMSASNLSDMYNAFTAYVVDAAYVVAKALKAMHGCNSSLHNCPTLTPHVSPADLVHYIQNVSLQGMTGRVAFDAQGNPKSSAYDIISYLPDTDRGRYSKNIVGKWSEREGLKVNTTMIQWPGGERNTPLSYCKDRCPPGYWQTRMKNCCWECTECPQGTISPRYAAPSCSNCTGGRTPNAARTMCISEKMADNQLSSAVGVVIIVLSAVGIVTACVDLVLIIQFYRTPLIKASNRELSVVLLALIIIIFVLSIIHIATPTEAICSLIQLWRYAVHSASVAILFIKTIRLAGAFQLHLTGVPRCCKRFFIDARLQIVMLVLISTCPILLALAWKVLDPPFVVKDVIAKASYISVDFHCKPYSRMTGQSLQVTSLSYLILLTLLCVYYSFKARNLPANFNETRYIGLSLYILLLSWVTYYPINSALEGWYVSTISSMTALLSGYGLLGCIFVPKMYIIIFQPDMNTNEFVRAELRSANRTMNSVSVQSSTQPI